MSKVKDTDPLDWTSCACIMSLTNSGRCSPLSILLAHMFLPFSSLDWRAVIFCGARFGAWRFFFLGYGFPFCCCWIKHNWNPNKCAFRCIHYFCTFFNAYDFLLARFLLSWLITIIFIPHILLKNLKYKNGLIHKKMCTHKTKNGGLLPYVFFFFAYFKYSSFFPVLSFIGGELAEVFCTMHNVC